MDSENSSPEQVDNSTDAFPSLQELVDKNDTTDIEAPKNKKNRSLLLTIVRIVVSIIVIVIGVYLILWLVSRAAKYETISEMLGHMWEHLQIMWERITR